METPCFFMDCDKRKTKEKAIDGIKKELLDLLIVIENKNVTEIDAKLTYLDIEVRNAKDLKEVVAIIKEFEELLKSKMI